MNPKIVREAQGVILNSLGDNITVKFTGEDTNKQFAIVQQKNQPGTGLPPHVHSNEDEVFKLIQGQVKFRLNNQEHVLSAGDAVFCPRGIPHSWEVIGDEQAVVDLTIIPAGMEKMFAEISAIDNQKENMNQIKNILNTYGISMIH
ncbi:MAG: hypothetical protein RI922_1621 [Bacteroidota bacterium]|jgi:quercetin dioxygenase-like cupin family protein